ncbi:tail fiber assembly protein [Rahnella sp. ChDrAdgB13]|uniref:tail fiber assembly protein n=1 Tax=Rahnella sp. ChDrAdgB13 TaxID=1850581 RepID=UPI001AD86983|nr:tail fiber assembly protein [Rahnella sp. ChDrAdgB13]
MSEQYFYSAKTGGFYSESHKASYEASPNGWPDDAIAVSDDDYKALFEGQAKGKIITADSNGKPVLSDPPAPTQEELIAQATTQRDSLMAIATSAIAPLQDAVDIDEATDEEIALLKAWKKYRVALSRLDLSTAPDIEWPTQPN